MLTSVILLTACNKKEATLPSPYWVEVRVKAEGRFDVLKIRQVMLVVDSVVPEGPNLGLPSLCDNLPVSGKVGPCSVMCDDYDNDGHREFIVDCTGEPGTLLAGRLWSYFLFGNLSANQRAFKIRAYLRGVDGLLGSGEATTDIHGNPIVISNQGNPVVAINVACIPNKSCAGDTVPQCELALSGPASVTASEGVSTDFSFAITDKPDLLHSWDIKLPSGEDPPHWISLAGISETGVLLKLSPPIGTAALSPQTQLLLQVANTDCSKTLPITIRVTETNQPPALSDMNNLTVQAGLSSKFYLAAYDPDQNDSLTYSLTGHPAWISVDPVAGTPPRRAWLVVTPPLGTTGSFGPVTVTVSDGSTLPLTDSSTFSVQVVDSLSNQAPVLNPVGNQTVSAGDTREITLSATDGDSEDRLTFSLNNNPPWASLTGALGRQTTLRLAPPMGTRSDWRGMIIRVADEHGAADQETVDILLNQQMNWPALTGVSDRTVVEGAAQATQFTVSAVDPDSGEQFTFSLDNQPHWVTLVDTAPFDNQVEVKIQAPPGSVGTYQNIIVRVKDRAGLADWKSFNLTVMNGNSPPVLSAIGNRLCPAGQVTEIPLMARDADGELVTFSIDESAEAWISLVDADPSDGAAILKCAPPAGTTGSHGVTVTARDPQQASVSETIQLHTDSTCHPPILETVGRKYLYAGESREISLRAVDSDVGEHLSFSIKEGEPWVQLIDNGDRTALLKIKVPDSLTPGTYKAGTVMVQDICIQGPLVAVEDVVLVIGKANQCPTVQAITSQTVMEDDKLVVPISAGDLDGDTVALTLDPTAPSWAAVQSFTWSGQNGTGALTLSPARGDSGNYTVSLVFTETGREEPCVTVSAFSVTVTPWQNHAPQLGAIGPQTLRENSSLTVNLTGTDRDSGQTLSFTVGSPTWAEVSGGGSSGEGNVAAGTLRLTPGFGDQGSHTVTVRLSDGTATAEEAVQITVEAGLAAPFRVDATDGSTTDEVTVSWGAVSDAEGYRVYRSDSADGTYVELGTVAESPYHDTGAAPGIKYHYKVRAYTSQWNSEGPLSASESGYRALEAPGGVAASDGVSAVHVEVAWSGVTGADSYKVYRSDTVDGTYSELGSATASPYQDTTAAPGATYHYKVKAYTVSSESLSAFSDADTGFRSFNAPDGVVATNGKSTVHVQVSWNPVSGADTYLIFRSVSSGGTFSELGSVSASPYQDTTATPGLLYYYKVKAHASSSGAYSDLSAEDDGYRKLDVPANVAASDGAHTGKVVITWSAVTGADSYRVLRASTSGGTYSELGSATGTTFDDTTIRSGTQYYKVKAYAVSSDSYSADSAPDSGYMKLGTPGNVTATQGTHTDRVEVTWNGVISAEKYHVYRSTTIGGTYVEKTSTTDMNYTDRMADAGTAYYYKVRAHAQAYGWSDYSSAALGYRGLASPANLVATQGTSNDHVGLSWNGVTGAETYTVHRSDSADGTYTQLVSTASTTFNEATALPGIKYYYMVRSHSQSLGDSGFTAPVSGYRGFPAPGAFKATDGKSTAHVQVSWTDLSGTYNYFVYRSETAGGSYSELGSVAASPYLDTTATPGLVYYFKLRAYSTSASAHGPYTSEDSGYRKLSAPANAAASDGTQEGKVEVSWDAVDGATRYHVYRSDSSGGTYSELGTAAASPYDDTTIRSGVKYYKVQAYATSSDSYSLFSAPDPGYMKLSTPGNVTATQGTHTDKVAVSWSGVIGADTYYIYRSATSGGTYDELTTTTSVSHDDTTAATGTTYYYKLRAHSQTYGWSNLSSSAMGYRGLAAPGRLTAAQGSSTDHVGLTWDPVSGADTYYVYRSDTGEGGYTELASTTSTFHNDTTATPGHKYYYMVKAHSATFGWSDFSANASGYRGLLAPTGVTATDGTSTAAVSVSWNAVTGASEYRVHRATKSTGTYTQLGTSATTSYSDTTGTPGTIYYYKVTTYAASSGAQSAQSDHDGGYRKLAVPTGLAASDGTYPAHVHISWDFMNGADKYYVYRSTSSGGTYTGIGDTTLKYYEDTTAAVGSIYYYKVRSYANSSTSYSDYTDDDSGFRQLTAPGSVAASDGTYTAHTRITWGVVTGADRYYVYRATTSGGTYAQIGSYTGSTTYDDTAGTAGVMYYYKVKAYSTVLTSYSDFSSYDGGYRSLAAPTNVAAGDGTSTSQVTVTWSSVTSATRYYVYRSATEAGTYTSLGNTTSLTYNDSTAVVGTKYYYKVKAYSSSIPSYSEYSAADSGYRKLATPTGVAASDGTSATQVTVTWSAVTGANRYYVYRATTSGGTYDQVGTYTTGTTFNDTTVPDHEDYHYKVKAYAVSSDSYSDLSDSDRGHLQRYTLYLDLQGDGPGTVTSTPSGMSCTADCEAHFAPGTSVTLRASAGAETDFTGWNKGGCYGSGTCTLVMDQDRWAAAIFTLKKNYMFVTKNTYKPGAQYNKTTAPLRFSSLTDADSICNDLASDAGLAGTYVAWLSTSTVNAKDRLGTARGWVRPDGKPFTDRVSDLIDNKVFYPPLIDEQGDSVGVNQWAYTGTRGDGVKTSSHCSSWSSSSGSATGGYPDGDGWIWTSMGGPGCGTGHHLYCFGTDHANAVTPEPREGRRAFITNGSFNPGGGLSSADALCQSEAASAGLSGTFLAFLGTETASPASRFLSIGNSWLRTDDVVLAASADAFMDGNLYAAIAVVARGNEHELAWTWTGGLGPRTIATGKTCSNWTSASSSYSGREGYAGMIRSNYFSNNDRSCNTTGRSVYCLEDNKTNIAFVTSTTTTGLLEHGGHTGLDAADSICNERANRGGLPPNNYVAWLSTTTVDAKDRLGSARGWLRPDGKPVADTVADITSGKLLHTLQIDESGNDQGSSAVWSGTLPSGLKDATRTCNSWTSGATGIWGSIGLASATTRTWTQYGSGYCSPLRHLYCFGTDYSTPLFHTPQTGRIAFVTKSSFTPGSGLAGADALCQSEATTAGLTGSFKALMATSGMPAGNRFSIAGPNWVRPDGYPIFNDVSDIRSSNPVVAPIEVYADGTYPSSNHFAWTGSTSPQTDPTDNCVDWTSTAGNGRHGHHPQTGAWFSYSTRACSTSYFKVYCFEE